MSKLYIVATPIGNLEDITLRALRILKEVDFILAEDTRVTKKLLSHFDIHTKVISFHEHSTDTTYTKVIDLLRTGKNAALVSDAGTPVISDPGSRLVYVVRHELPETEVTPIPGPSSVTAALSVSGISAPTFYFAGFAPHKKGRETFFRSIVEKINSDTAFVFFESPHRIIRALESLATYCPDTNIVITRELTKVFEEVLSGKPVELLDFFQKNSEKVRGEFVVIVHE